MLFTTQARGSDEYRTPSLNQPFLLLVPTYCRSWTAQFANLSFHLYAKSHSWWHLTRLQSHSLCMTPGPLHCYVFYRRFLSGSFINRYRVIAITIWLQQGIWLCMPHQITWKTTVTRLWLFGDIIGGFVSPRKGAGGYGRNWSSAVFHTVVE